MRQPLERHYGKGDLHFVTFSCFRRRPYLMKPSARTAFVETLKEIRARHRFHLFGYVVMPEHVHLLLDEAGALNPSKVIQVVKQNVSSALGHGTGIPFWQRRFYDFNTWSAGKINEKLIYMHENPLRRGLVAHPRDWPWSSWSHYAMKDNGLISMDSFACLHRAGTDLTEDRYEDVERKPAP
ncbi:MAG TPA: transposase [Candidatus Acidoferrales bacterium]|nr:transposase [Candidatus Acidoferrales bacterium]